MGVDRYDQFPSLKGCASDVRALGPLLAKNEDGTPNFECQLRGHDNGRVSTVGFSADLQRLLGPGADIALLYFAGHGVPDNSDTTLACSDGTRHEPGVPLSRVLAWIANSPVAEVVLVLDCCFSGAAGAVPQLGTATSVLRSGLTILTASRGDQQAAETASGGGHFSTYLRGALEGGAADVLGKVTVAGLYAYLNESFGAWDQRPMLKANVDRLHDLRVCAPSVAREELRRLPGLFNNPEAQLALDPSYEPTELPRHAEHEDDFKTLQHLRAAKLVEPVNTEHLYFAAMQSDSCRLTRLGRHYWHMAYLGRL